MKTKKKPSEAQFKEANFCLLWTELNSENSGGVAEVPNVGWTFDKFQNFQVVPGMSVVGGGSETKTCFPFSHVGKVLALVAGQLLTRGCVGKGGERRRNNTYPPPCPNLFPGLHETTAKVKFQEWHTHGLALRRRCLGYFRAAQPGKTQNVLGIVVKACKFHHLSRSGEGVCAKFVWVHLINKGAVMPVCLNFYVEYWFLVKF